MEKLKNQGEQVTQAMIFLDHLAAKKNGESRFEAHRYPILALNLNSTVMLRICDPYLA